jgi:hypothetical protein
MRRSHGASRSGYIVGAMPFPKGGDSPRCEIAADEWVNSLIGP